MGKINHTVIREKTKFKDIVNYTLSMKWKWAGHVGRMKETDGQYYVQGGLRKENETEANEVD